MIGSRFNRLIVIRESSYKGNRQKNWECICDCGNKITVRGPKLKHGNTQSCGCLKIEKSKQNIKLGIKWTKSEIGKKFLRERNSYRRGIKAYNWQGGKEEDNIRLRRSPEAMQWRLKVYERDGFQCQLCGEKQKRLNAHHKKPWSFFPELRYEIDNGLTVCVDCHRLLHKANGNPKRKLCQL